MLTTIKYNSDNIYYIVMRSNNGHFSFDIIQVFDLHFVALHVLQGWMIVTRVILNCCGDLDGQQFKHAPSIPIRNTVLPFGNYERIAFHEYSGAKKYLVSHQLCKFSHLKR
jgi:hypothetical protein